MDENFGCLPNGSIIQVGLPKPIEFIPIPEIDEKKLLIEFLGILIRLTKDNIDFLNHKEIKYPTKLGKYKEEFEQIQDLINSFDFVKDKENG